MEFFHPQPLCQAHDKAGFCVCMFLLSVLEKLRYSRHICQQLLPSARGGCRATATDVPGLSHRRGRQLWARAGAEGPGPLSLEACVHVCVHRHACPSSGPPPVPLISVPSHCLSLSLPPHPSLLPSPSFPPPLLPSLPHSHSSPSFSLGLTKAPGKRWDCIKCSQ